MWYERKQSVCGYPEFEKTTFRKYITNRITCYFSYLSEFIFAFLFQRCSEYFYAPRVWDKKSKVAYWYSGDQWIAGEDVESVKHKVNDSYIHTVTIKDIN